MMELIGWCILLFIIIGITAWSGMSIFNSQKKYEQQYMDTIRQEQQDGIKFADGTAIYLGGFPEIAGSKNTRIKVKSNEIIFNINNTYEKCVNMDNINDVMIKTEQQITKDISLGKMIMFGALAFSMKNQKNIIKNYLVINYKDVQDKEYNLVFESKQLERLTQEIRQSKFGTI